MNEAMWARVKELFHAALERAPEERTAFLANACGDDRALRTELERLLAAQGEAGSFLEWSPMAAVAGGDSKWTPMAGRVLGRYRIDRLIGTGGMGEVYAAEDTDLGRAVAIKVVASADVGAQATLRREAQHASQLNHPHICTIYEVGDFDGQAFFAMEYVAGSTLDRVIPSDGLPEIGRAHV